MSNPLLHQSSQEYYPTVKWILHGLDETLGGATDNYMVFAGQGGIEDGDLFIWSNNFYNDGTASINGVVNTFAAPTYRIGVWGDAFNQTNAFSAVFGSGSLTTTASGSGANSAVDDSFCIGGFINPNTGSNKVLDFQLTVDNANSQDAGDKAEYGVCISFKNIFYPNNIGTSAPAMQEGSTFPNPYNATKSIELSFVHPPLNASAGGVTPRFSRARAKILGIFATVQQNIATALTGLVGIENFNFTSSTWSSSAITYSQSAVDTAVKENNIYVVRFITANTGTGGIPSSITTSEGGCVKIWSRLYTHPTDSAVMYMDCLRPGGVMGFHSTFSGWPSNRGVVMQSYLITFEM